MTGIDAVVLIIGMQYPGTDVLRIKKRNKSVVWFWLEVCAKFRVTKFFLNHTSDILLICPDDHTGTQGDIADIITCVKFCVDQFGGFEVLAPPIFPFSIGLAGRPYNSVSTTKLHCKIYTHTCNSLGPCKSSPPLNGMCWFVDLLTLS